MKNPEKSFKVDLKPGKVISTTPDGALDARTSSRKSEAEMRASVKDLLSEIRVWEDKLAEQYLNGEISEDAFRMALQVQTDLIFKKYDLPKNY